MKKSVTIYGVIKVKNGVFSGEVSVSNDETYKTKTTRIRTTSKEDLFDGMKIFFEDNIEKI